MIENTLCGAMRQSRGARVVVGWLVAIALITSCGCATKIGTIEVGFQRAYEQINTNALLKDQFSAVSANVLHRYNIEELFEDAPLDALRFLQEKVKEDNRRDLLFAISELSYHIAEHEFDGRDPENVRGARKCYLSAAIHAYFFLFDEDRGDPPDPFDRIFRLACDLYNIGLARAMSGADDRLVIEGGARELPMGAIRLSIRQGAFPWGFERFEEILASDRLAIRGLSRRNRRAGLGVPFVAVEPGQGRVSFKRSMSGTFFLRMESKPEELGGDAFKGVLEFYSALEDKDIRVGDRLIPLESDTSVQIAYTLNQKILWDLGLREFFRGKSRLPKGLYLTTPYSPERVPVVFVHGTFSSPVWWAEMMNTLRADPALRRNCQFWFYFYDSGKPISFSAFDFREELTRKVQELDPDGGDAGLRRMVVIGHSQGGLMTKLTAMDTGDALVKKVTGKSLEELDLSQKSRETIRPYVIIEPLPFVRRVVFISTPHRGSFLAGKMVRRLVRGVISLPVDIVQEVGKMMSIIKKLELSGEFAELDMLSSLDSMSPKNRGLLAMAEIPLAPGIKGHSIIAVKDDEDPLQGDDGVVEYQSAHVDWVESELIVQSGHSCQGHPLTIEEVRRILLLHLAEGPGIISSDQQP
ncbi:MAG: hypothetical protein GY859_23215 [Desulfobacterales bacterium]|nr:hypothetical protein [Desulfobacterales bacterium]